MARNNNNTLFLLAVLGILLFFGLYCAWGKTNNSKDNESYAHSNQIRESPDIEFIQQPDEGEPGPGDDFQLIGVAEDDPAYSLGLGSGEGIYGSSQRYTSSMVGN